MMQWLLETFQNKPVDSLMMAVVVVIAGSYVPWNRIMPVLSKVQNPFKPKAMAVTDAHTAIHKLIDVINVCRAHGDVDTAEKLGALMPNVVVACCAAQTETPQT